jgi:hypothetical protein
MFTKDDLMDVIMKHLSTGGIREERGETTAKIFISDWELRRMLKPGEQIVKVPKNAIISPLSRDWLDFNNIKIVYEK